MSTVTRDFETEVKYLKEQIHKLNSTIEQLKNAKNASTKDLEADQRHE